MTARVVDLTAYRARPVPAEVEFVVSGGGSPEHVDRCQVRMADEVAVVAFTKFIPGGVEMSLFSLTVDEARKLAEAILAQTGHGL